ncbi:MAG TPA: class I SAM-dependent methyltransferase [Actinomycetales bacterium]|nr:class I SAM-dependent methyltransferase [Actinomycetales bacterium]
MRHGEFLHPRLVGVYDAAFPWSREDDFFVALVEQVPSDRVLDLGCGTGRLALGLAAAGHRVTGVDPAAASLRAARGKPGADRVTWIEGTSRVLPEDAFDVAVMTSHVAQFFVSDEDWREVLGDLNRALAWGGRLVFDTRDARARHWERWSPAETRRHVVLGDGTVVLMWSEVTDRADDVVTSCQYYAFADGEELFSVVTLRWRSEAEVTSSLQEAGFTVERIYGGWRGEPVTKGDGELIVVARKE